MVNKLEVYGMSTLAEVVSFISDKQNFAPTIVDTRKEFYENQTHCDLDYADVRGQENVKRALEIAAAGGHNHPSPYLKVWRPLRYIPSQEN